MWSPRWRAARLCSANISSISSISSLTWAPSPRSLLFRTWYLFPHFSTSPCSGFPSLSMRRSMLVSPSQSPWLNSTRALLHIWPPPASSCFSKSSLWASVKEQLALATSRIAQDEGAPRRSEVTEKPPGVSSTVTILPPTSPCVSA